MLESLWIMRHGLAEADFDTDFTRALSDVGKRQAINVSLQLKTDDNELPTSMWVSPFKRTQQTANIVHHELGLNSPFVTEDLLVHFANHQLLAELLLAQSGKLIVISHMPIVAKLCQYIDPACSIYGFQTAQVVKLVFNSQGKASVDKTYLPSN